MKNINFTLGQKINAGNHIISIGSFDVHDVAIISKHTGHFVKFKDIPKRNSCLNKIKLRFNMFLCSDQDLVFQHVWFDDVMQMIDILKNNK